MEGLAEGHQDVVGHVHHVVNRTQADYAEALFEPVGTFLDGHAGDGQAAVTGAEGSVGHFHLHRLSLGAVDGEAVDRRLGQGRRVVAVGSEVGGQIASYAEVRSGVDAVGREVHFDYEVVGQIIELGGGGAGGGSAFGQHDDAVVRSAHTDFVLGTNHAKRFHAADFGFLDFEFFVTIVESGAHGSHHHGLAGSHVGRAAHDLGGFTVAKVHGGDVEVVAIRVFHASEHLADNDAAQAAAD